MPHVVVSLMPFEKSSNQDKYRVVIQGDTDLPTSLAKWLASSDKVSSLKARDEDKQLRFFCLKIFHNNLFHRFQTHADGIRYFTFGFSKVGRLPFPEEKPDRGQANGDLVPTSDNSDVANSTDTSGDDRRLPRPRKPVHYAPLNDENTMKILRDFRARQALQALQRTTGVVMSSSRQRTFTTTSRSPQPLHNVVRGDATSQQAEELFTEASFKQALSLLKRILHTCRGHTQTSIPGMKKLHSLFPSHTHMSARQLTHFNELFRLVHNSGRQAHRAPAAVSCGCSIFSRESSAQRTLTRFGLAPCTNLLRHLSQGLHRCARDYLSATATANALYKLLTPVLTNEAVTEPTPLQQALKLFGQTATPGNQVISAGHRVSVQEAFPQGVFDDTFERIALDAISDHMTTYTSPLRR
jgi:hypothetical protein